LIINDRVRVKQPFGEYTRLSVNGGGWSVNGGIGEWSPLPQSCGASFQEPFPIFLTTSFIFHLGSRKHGVVIPEGYPASFGK